MIDELTVKPPAPNTFEISADDVQSDIEMILWSLHLHGVRRYFRQRYWEQETLASKFADRIEPDLKLESVSAHSWHVADIVILLSGHFNFIDRDKATRLAIIHDKLELITGDYDPVGRDGSGSKTHAFNLSAMHKKTLSERAAAELYIEKVRPSARSETAELLHEVIVGKSIESRFVKAVDKIQALSYVIEKKHGEITDRHAAFTAKYSSKAIHYFPWIRHHYNAMLRVFLCRIAERRQISPDALERILFNQLELGV